MLEKKSINVRMSLAVLALAIVLMNERDESTTSERAAAFLDKSRCLVQTSLRA